MWYTGARAGEVGKKEDGGERVMERFGRVTEEDVLGELGGERRGAARWCMFVVLRRLQIVSSRLRDVHRG